MVNNPKKIIWAIDVFSENFALQKKALRAIQAIGRETKVETIPVYVLPLPDNELMGTRSFSDPEAMTQLVKHKMEATVDRANLCDLQDPKVLQVAGNSIRECVAHLVQYAQKIEANLIVASTHGRKGVRRALLGSFAETLFLQTEIPVLIVNPQGNLSRRIKRILFPTDFSEKSHLAFDQACQLSKQLQATLILFNKRENDIGYATPEFYMANAYTPNAKEMSEERQRLAREWAVQASAKYKIEIETDVDARPGFVCNAILKKAAQYKVDMIALASESGPIASGLLGSISRQLVRNATCPIWLIHPFYPAPKQSKGRKIFSSKTTMCAGAK